jgi:hypothetical protein
MKVLSWSLVIILIVIALAIFQVRNTSAAGTALGSLAASMQPGTWAQLTTNNINPTLSNPGGASGIIFGYTEYIKWDPVGRRLYYLGGDHAESGTPVMRHVQYDDATNSWSILPEQSWFTAFASHGYDHGAIDPAHRYFYFRPPDNLTMYRWNMDTHVWTQMPANNVIQYNSCCVGIDYFPELHGVMWASDESGDNGGVTRLNDATGQWDRIGQAAAYPMGDYHNFAEYNPVFKVMVFGGGESGSATRKIWKLDANGRITALKDAPVALGIQNAIFTVDPVSGDYLVFTSTNQFYVYNVVTDTWTLRASGSAVPIWTTNYQDPVHGAVGGSIDTYGVNVFVTCDGTNNCKVNIYKHSAGSGNPGVPPPPPPDPSPVTPFDFSSSNGGDVGVLQGQSKSNTVTVTLSSGTAQSVSFSASGLPAGATASFSATSCVPTCSSTITVRTSATTPAGSYPITVTAVSDSLSHTTSFTLTVSASNTLPPVPPSPVPAPPVPPPTGTSLTFAQKCAQPGVINCFGFDSSSTLFYTWPTGTVCDAAFAGQNNFGFGEDRRTQGNTAAVVQNGQCVFPQIDTTTTHSGGGSLKFTIPSNSDADSSGFFTEPFKRNSDGTFPYVGPGSPLGNVFYFQFYQKLDSNFVNTDFKCLGGECGGWKQIIWYGNPPNGSSSGSLESTMNNGWQRNVPQFYGQQGTDDYGVEDAIGCTFDKATSQGGSGSGYNSRPNYQAPLNPTCQHYIGDQWMEFTGRIEIRGANNAPASRVQLWVNGQPAVDYGAARVDWGTDGGQGFGQFLMTPYHTNKDPNQVHPVGHTWYDDLIISTQPIAMTGGGNSGGNPPNPVGNPPTVSTTAPASGSTVSGSSVTVSASASGSAAIAGVQFQLDGSNLGSEVTTTPYSIKWDTTTTTNGSHTLTAIARDTAGSQATSSSVTVTVSNGVPPVSFNFSLSLASTGIVQAGKSVSFPVTLSRVSGTTQPVSLSVSGVPSGITAEFSTSSCSPDCNSNLKFSTSASAAAGSYPITVKGSSGSLSHTTSMVLTVTNPTSPTATFDFSVSVPGGGSVKPGQSASYPVAVSLISGTTQSVSLSASGGLSGVTATLSASSCNPSCTSILTLGTSPSTGTGSYTITVTGTSGSLSHTASLTLAVNTTQPADDHDDHAPVQSGYAVVTPVGPATSGTTTGLVVFETFGLRGQSSYGALQAGVLPPDLTTDAILFIDTSDRLYKSLGVAMMNPNASNANVTLTLRGTNGTQLASTTVNLPSHQQISKLIRDLFSGQSSIPSEVTGTLEISSSSSLPISAIGLRFRGPNFSTLPVTNLSGNAGALPTLANGVGGAGAVLLPQFAAGGGWATELVLLNTGTNSLTVRVDLFKLDGTPLTTSLNGQSGTSFTNLTIPPGGVLTLAPRDRNGDDDF